MSGTKKLSSDGPHKDVANDQKCETLERRFATLLRNELINGDDEIAKRVMDAGKPATFSKGEKIIEQGASDDCVYFMLSGDVEVRINDRHIDFTGAPYTVGEMAAKKAGAPRTADVIVHSARLETLVVSGTDFRKLMREFLTFRTNLENAVDTLSRKKISQLGEPFEKKGTAWWTISAFTGGVVGVSAVVIAWLAALNALQIALISVPLGVLAFVWMLLSNPALRYRNMAYMAAGTLILSVLYGSLSFWITIDGKQVDLPLIDFSVQTDQKLDVLIVQSVVLLALTLLCGIFDLKLTTAKKE